MDKDSVSAGEKRPVIKIREMLIDDIAIVFDMGEELFKAQEVPNMYRTWDPYEFVGLFNSDTEFCLVAEIDDDIIGFALGTTIEKSHSAWKYGYLIWLGVMPAYQRKGISEKLFRRFKDIMLKNDARMLIVDTQIETLFRSATIDAGYALPEKGPVVDAIKNVFQRHSLPWSSNAFRSHSDANQIWVSGIKPVILGPGKLEQAHSQEESISFQQVCLAAEIYLDIMLTAGLEDRRP